MECKICGTDWWYYGLEHGQHVSLYSKKTFLIISKIFKLNYYNIGELHILTNKKICRIRLLLVKMEKFSFHNLIFRFLKSKTWVDHKPLH